ncbi:MAG: hypothetical protein DWQ44_03965 [Bacteroidetes bacterium]|nr:MAG: hypothetical protein DWQ33_03400 [Bacteroidota bacterium]REK00385.1 MAG: hypothetical protein DWQ39_11860 [Bacteroidota bacterium]REK35504.1 MAG: hypothetical protein DWQ44_03965 [Bacteroidota bacterium]REK46860.1 MAG: hypothetical protein DWQ48_13925 [Bacteroidota bacterium]
MERDWESVYISDKIHLVEIVRAVLEDNNIPSVAIDKRDSSYIGIGDIEVYVHPDNSILARLIIEQNKL